MTDKTNPFGIFPEGVDAPGELPVAPAASEPLPAAARGPGRPRKAARVAETPEQAAQPLKDAVLDSAELDRIRAEARALVAEELRAARVKAALEEAIAEERWRAGLPTEGPPPVASYEDVYISLPEFAPYIALDGTRFYHNTTVKVSPPQAQMLRYQMQLSWEHEDEAINGKSRRDLFRRQRNVDLTQKAA